MSVTLIVLSSFDPGTYFVQDDGIPGNSVAGLRTPDGDVIPFSIPDEHLTITASAGRSVVFNLTEWNAVADVIAGSLANSTQNPDSIQVQRIARSQDATLVSNGVITEFGADAAADIVAGTLIMSASTGIGTSGNAIETQTSLLEAETNTGGIYISNFGSVQIGGANDEANGLHVLTSGNITFTNLGSILLGDVDLDPANPPPGPLASVTGGSASGNVTLAANGFDSDIIASSNLDAIRAGGGAINLVAGRDIAFGIIGNDFDNDVRARGAITINAGRDFLLDGFSDLASDDFGDNTGGNVVINAGRNIHLRNIAGTDASILASGSAGADVLLTTGPGGALVLDAPRLDAISSNSGDVIVNADRVLINSASGIEADTGQVTLRPVTDGRDIFLGSAGDAAFALEISNAELDRIFAPTLTIGNDNSGQITVISAISPDNAPDLVLRSGGDIAVQASITTSGSLELRAGDSVFLSSSPTLAVGGALSIFVDTLGNDGGIGGFVNLNGAGINAASISVNGSGENDTLMGAESVNQVVHGNGGNDTIISSGEGQYFGDAGNDLMMTGLSSGLVPEVLDGGSGVDTLDTQSFGGDYVINLANGVTNFDYESLVGFENVITGAGHDIIVGTAGANVIQSGEGNDTLNGGAGIDTMDGGLGNDRFYVDNAGDSVVEGAGGGSDRVLASVGYVLGAAAQVEILSTNSTAGTGAINLVGNNFVQNIVGNAGANTLNGLGGADLMQGLGGNDSYYVDNAGDSVVEGAGGGSDRVLTSVSYALAAGAEVEFFTTRNAAGVDAINLVGNNFAQSIIGNGGNNFINSLGGADTLTGLGGNDIFMFNAAIGGGNIDDITDFSVANDTIRLENAIFANISGTGTLTAAQFVANASGTAQDASDRVIYETDNGRLIYDANGSATGGRFHFATLDAGLAVTNADFFIV